MRIFRCFFGVLPILLIGCGTLQSEVHSSFDWEGGSDVRLETPESDPWNLVPLVRQELRDAGYQVVSRVEEKVDLVASFTVEEALDINEVGEIVPRPKEMRIRFFDPPGMKEVAAASYRLSSSERPEHAMRKLFRELRSKSEREPETDGLAESSKPGAPVNREYHEEKKDVAEENVEPNKEGAENSRSPWIPRLESWGFEEWGQPEKENEW